MKSTLSSWIGRERPDCDPSPPLYRHHTPYYFRSYRYGVVGGVHSDSYEADVSHTPGPWYVWLPRGSDAGCRTIRTEKGRTHGGYHGTELATTNGLSDDAEDAANARLMAAAPELLAALENLLREHTHGDRISAGDEAIAAIRNAKGEA
jgi:hypothetical protein